MQYRGNHKRGRVELHLFVLMSKVLRTGVHSDTRLNGCFYSLHFYWVELFHLHGLCGEKKFSLDNTIY